MKVDVKKVDVNLWFQPLDLSKAAAQTYYAACRANAWSNLYGNLDRYAGATLLADAMTLSKNDRRSVWAAMRGKTQAGILQLDLKKEARGRAGYISFLFLNQEYRGSGLGIQIIGKAVSVFRPMKRDKLRLVCSQNNETALRFYKKYGFHITGSMPGVYTTLYNMEKYIGYEYRGELDE